MPDTRYRYYTLVLADAMLAVGKALPDNSTRRPDQMIRNVVSALGHAEEATSLSWIELLENLRHEGLPHLAQDLEAKNYWGKLITQVAPAPSVPLFTPSDPLGPLLDAESAFADAVSYLADRGEVLIGDDLATARYGLEAWTIENVVDRIGPDAPRLAHRLMLATRCGRTRFDDHPLAALYLAASLFRFYEAVTGTGLYVKVPGSRRRQGLSIQNVREAIHGANPAIASQLDTWIAVSPAYLGMGDADATFREQHVQRGPKHDGNPLKVLRNRFLKKLDPLLKDVVARDPALDAEPALAVAYAFALPGGSALADMLGFAIEERLIGVHADTRFPSIRTLLSWLYAHPSDDVDRVPRALANFARADRVGMVDPKMIAMKVIGDMMETEPTRVEPFLNAVDERDAGDGDVQLVASYRDAVLDVIAELRGESPIGDKCSGDYGLSTAALQLWSLANRHRVVRRALSSPSFRARVEHASAAVGTKPHAHWRLVRERLEASLNDGPLDFTDDVDETGRPRRPSEHPFAEASFGLDLDDDTANVFRDRLDRIEEHRRMVVVSTAEELMATIDRWIEHELSGAHEATADTRTRLFFLDALQAANRQGVASVAGELADVIDPRSWTDGEPPEGLMADHFSVDGGQDPDDESKRMDRVVDTDLPHQVLSALAGFLELVVTLETNLQDEIAAADWMDA